MHTLLLYTTSGCHLCEEAEQLLEQLLAPDWWQLQPVEIADSAALMAQFGTRVPVLGHGGRTLDWPFTQGQVIEFLQEVLQDGEAYAGDMAQ